MACKTPWVTLSLLFTSLLKLERRMIAFCFGDDGAAVVSEEVDLLRLGGSSKGFAFTTTDDDDAWSSPPVLSSVMVYFLCLLVLTSSSSACRAQLNSF